MHCNRLLCAVSLRVLEKEYKHTLEYILKVSTFHRSYHNWTNVELENLSNSYVNERTILLANPLNFNLNFLIVWFPLTLIVWRQNTFLTTVNLICVQDTVKRIILSWLNCCLEYQLHSSLSLHSYSQTRQSPLLYFVSQWIS